MNVDKLIKELSKHAPNTEVVISNGNYPCPIDSVKAVHVNTRENEWSDGSTRHDRKALRLMSMMDGDEDAVFEKALIDAAESDMDAMDPPENPKPE